MKTKYTKSASTLMTLCFVVSPLASGATTTIIGNGVNGGELDRKFVDSNQVFPAEGLDVYWNGGLKPDNNVDYVEFRNANGLTATVGVHWMDSSASQNSQVITNNARFDVAADTTMTLSIDFSRWAFGSNATQDGTVVTFSMGSTTLGTITYAMDTNGTGVWNTYTVTDVPVAAGTNQAFVINSTSIGAVAPTTWGFALDNLRLTSTVVPEPSTALMGVFALSFAIGRRRRA
jgi:hypothetical protein